MDFATVLAGTLTANILAASWIWGIFRAHTTNTADSTTLVAILMPAGFLAASVIVAHQ